MLKEEAAEWTESFKVEVLGFVLQNKFDLLADAFFLDSDIRLLILMNQDESDGLRGN